MTHWQFVPLWEFKQPVRKDGQGGILTTEDPCGHHWDLKKSKKHYRKGKKKSDGSELSPLFASQAQNAAFQLSVCGNLALFNEYCANHKKNFRTKG